MAGTIEIGRGCADTVPQQHLAGERVWFPADETADDVTEYAEGETVSVKILTNTGSRQLPIAAAPAIPLAFDARQVRPYPPGNLKINGIAEHDPDEPLNSAIELTWAHRDRLLQGDQLIDSEAGDIGPEPGTTYGVEYYTDDGVTLVDSELEIAGNASTPWDAPQEGRYRIDVFSVRGGLVSWQRHQRVVLVGAPRWTPADLQVPPSIWLDWESPINEISGRASEWTDRSGNGHNYVQSQSSRRPLIVSGTPENIRVLNWDSSARLMQPVAAQGIVRNTDGLWMAVVSRRVSTTAADSNMAFVPSAGSNATALSIKPMANPSDGRHWVITRRLGTDPATTFFGPNDADWHAHIVAADYTAGVSEYSVDGVVSSGSVTAGLSQDVNGLLNPGIGRWPEGSADSSGLFQIAAKLVGRGPLSEANRQRLEGWQAHAIGLWDRLPANHPFRLVPPYLGTPVLHASFSSSPTIFGFAATADVGDIGVAVGPVVESEFGTLFNSEPMLSAGQGIAVTSSGSNLDIRLDGITLAGPAMQAVLLDHKGGLLGTYPLTNHTGYWTASGPGELEEGGVYYVRIEEA